MHAQERRASGGKVFMPDQGRVAPDHPQHEARSPRLPVLPDRPKDPALGDLGRRQPFINSLFDRIFQRDGAHLPPLPGQVYKGPAAAEFTDRLRLEATELSPAQAAALRLAPKGNSS
jgi:hypothetical protein